MNEKERIKPPIQTEATTSSIPNTREIPSPAMTPTVQTGHIIICMISQLVINITYLTIPPGGIIIISNKQMTNDKLTKQKILHRFQIAKGHLEKVIKMLEEDAYCVDVVHQSIAVQAALKKADEAVLENHLKTCVAESIRKGKDKEVIEEVMRVIEKK